MSRIRLCATTLALLLIAAVVSAQQPEPDETLLQLGAQRVTMSDFLLHLRQTQPLVRYADLPAAEQQKLLDEFLLRKLLAHHARAAALDNEPHVRAQMEFFADGVLAQAFQSRWLEQAAVSKEEIAAYYKSNAREFTSPPRVHLLHALYSDAEKAAAAREQLSADASFQTLAAQKRADSQLLFIERQWFTSAGLIPPLAEAAFALRAGETSNVIRSSYGYHVLRVEAREPARQRALDEVRGEITARLRQAKAGEYFRKLLSEARADSAKKTAKR